MNWFETQRLAWIGEALQVYGFINREHLQRKFGISQPQASKDLQTYQRLHPGGHELVEHYRLRIVGTVFFWKGGVRYINGSCPVKFKRV